MYQDTVKRLLEKHFGKPSNSLTVGDTVRPTSHTYYISLPDWDEVNGMREYLARGLRDPEGPARMPELRRDFNYRHFDGDNWCQVARLDTSEDAWRVKFYRVTGVRFHKSFGKSVAATFIIPRDCEFWLSSGEADEGFGLWRPTVVRNLMPGQKQKDGGINYWCGKLLKTNNPFRQFVADLLEEVGTREKKFILKDAARAIRSSGLFLPEVSYGELLVCRTPEDMARRMLPDGFNAGIKFNRLDLNRVYAICRVMPLVDRQDRHILAEMPADALRDIVDLRMLFEGFDTVRFVAGFYAFWRGYDDDEMLVEDYVETCLDTYRPIRLNFEERTVRRAHDMMVEAANKARKAEELKMPLVTLPSRFEQLAECLKGRGNFEWIMTSLRLHKEGEAMHNCVFSRRSPVRQDMAAIFHWQSEGTETDYTIQFSMGRSGGYVVDEVRARCNRPISDRDYEELRERLKGAAELTGSAEEYRQFTRMRDAYVIDPRDPRYWDEEGRWTNLEQALF